MSRRKIKNNSDKIHLLSPTALLVLDMIRHCPECGKNKHPRTVIEENGIVGFHCEDCGQTTYIPKNEVLIKDNPSPKKGVSGEIKCPNIT